MMLYNYIILLFKNFLLYTTTTVLYYIKKSLLGTRNHVMGQRKKKTVAGCKRQTSTVDRLDRATKTTL